MTKTEQKILEHLHPVEYGLNHDTYFCGISIENKNIFMYSVKDKVENWVVKNGGVFKVLSEKVINHRIHRKGFVVQIVFPSSCKRDMKNIMSTLHYEKQRIVINPQ